MRLKNRIRLYKNYFIKRALAYALDLAIVVSLAKVISFYLFTSLTKISGNNFFISFELWEVATKIQYVITYMAYFITSFYIYEGQTIGMRAFSLQIRQSGFTIKDLTFFSCLNRAMANYISQELYFIPFIYSIFNLKNRSFSDIASSSQVVFHSHKQRQISSDSPKDNIRIAA